MGKSGGALSAWIKEFTSLVFVQTIQAFIFAIILSIILFGLGKNQAEVSKEGISADDNNAAIGLMSVFALLSVFKVEDMVKKIFGVGDTKAAHRNAMGSLAKTAIAAKLGSNVLNNTGKFLGGLRKTAGAREERRKLKKRLDEDMKDEGMIKDSNGEWVPASRNAQTRTTARGLGNVSGVGVVRGSGTTGGDLDIEPVDLSRELGGSQVEMSAAAKRRVKNALRAYEDKAAEINKARNEGIKDMISSMTETVGAGFGATAGGILGGADGDIEGLAQGMMAGAGIGDAAGKNAIEAIDRATQFVRRNTKRGIQFAKGERGVSNKDLKRAIDEYKDAVNNANSSRNVDMNDLDI